MSAGGYIAGAALIASTAFLAWDRFERRIAEPIGAQVWIEERAGVRADNAQAIAEVLIRRADRASKVKGRTVTIADLQAGRVVDTFTGPISAWAEYGAALDKGRAAWASDPVFRAQTTAAALRAYWAVKRETCRPLALRYLHRLRVKIAPRQAAGRYRARLLPPGPSSTASSGWPRHCSGGGPSVWRYHNAPGATCGPSPNLTAH